MDKLKEKIEEINKYMDSYIKEAYENYQASNKDWLDDNFHADENAGFTQWDTFYDCLDSNDWQLTEQEGFAYDLGFVCGLRTALEIVNRGGN